MDSTAEMSACQVGFGEVRAAVRTTASNHIGSGHGLQSPFWKIASELIENRHKFRARRGRPCPICQHVDGWCIHNEKAALCPRSDGRGSPKKYGEYGFLHVLDPLAAPWTAPAKPRPEPKALPDWAHAAQHFAANARRDGCTKLPELADALSVPTWTLDALGIGHGRCAGAACWTMPEKDSSGKIIGLNRRLADGRKRQAAGSRRGLTCTTPAAILEGDQPVVVVEGASDTMAGLAMGLVVVGRPSCTGGVDQLAELLADLPADRLIIILGEHDQKPDGSWPGRDGAIHVARRLAEKLSRPVQWALPPDGCKDLRAWWILRKSHFRNQPAAEIGRAFLDALKTIPSDGSARSQASKSAEKRLETCDHAVPNGGAELPKLPSFLGFDCPSRIGLLQRDRGNGRNHQAIQVPCRRRGCAICGEVWIKRRQVWYRYHLRQESRLWYLKVRVDEWPRLRRRISRRGGRYIWAETSDEFREVLSTVPLAGGVELSIGEGISRMEAMICNARQPGLIESNGIEYREHLQAVGQSKAWQLPADQPEDKETVEVTSTAEDGTETIKSLPRWQTLGEVRLAPEKVGRVLTASGIEWEETESRSALCWAMPEGYTEQDCQDIYQRLLLVKVSLRRRRKWPANSERQSAAV